jgi:hypothetical protein
VETVKFIGKPTSYQQGPKMATKKDSAPSLNVYLKVVEKVIGAFPSAIFTSHKSGTMVTMSSLYGSAKFIFPVTFLTGSESIQVPYDTLQLALGKKTNVAYALKNDMLVISSGRSNVELRATTAAVVPEVSLLKDATEFKMTASFWAFLNEKLPLLKLEKVHSAQTDPRLFIRVTSKMVSLVGYDSNGFQLVYAGAKNTFDIEPMELNVAYPRFATTMKELPSSDVVMQVSNEAVLIRSGHFTIVTMMTELADNEPTGDLVLTKAKELGTRDSNYFSVSKEALEDYLMSAKAVSLYDSKGGADAVIKFALKGSTLALSVNSSAGKASSSLEVNGKGSATFGLEVKFLQNILSKCSTDTVTMSVNDGALCVKTDELLFAAQTSEI